MRFECIYFLSIMLMCSVAPSRPNFLQKTLSALKSKLIGLAKILKKEKLPKLDLTEEEKGDFIGKNVIEFIKKKVKKGFAFKDFLPYVEYVTYSSVPEKSFESRFLHAPKNIKDYPFSKGDKGRGESLFLAHVVDSLPLKEANLLLKKESLSEFRPLAKRFERLGLFYFRQKVIQIRNKKKDGDRLSSILSNFSNSDLVMLGLAVAPVSGNPKKQLFPSFLEKCAQDNEKKKITIVLVDKNFEQEESFIKFYRFESSFEKNNWKKDLNVEKPFCVYKQKKVTVVVVPFFLAPYISDLAGWVPHHLPGDAIAIAIAEYLKTVNKNGKSILIVDGFYPFSDEKSMTAADSISKAFIDYMLKDWWPTALKGKRAWVYTPDSTEKIDILKAILRTV